MVEAAGVEPASESTPSQDSTCVAALEYSRPTSKSDVNRGSLAPMKSRHHSSEPPRGDQPAFMTSSPRPAGRIGVDVTA